MDLAEYYKKSDPVLGVAKILYLRLFNQFESKEFWEIADSTSGGTPNRGISSYFNGDIPWLKSGELNDSTIESCEEFITEEGLKNSSAKLFPKGTLLVAMYGATAGKTGVLGFDSTTNQAVCAVFPKPEVVQEYLYWFLRQHRIDFIIQSKGGAQPNISQRVINATKIPVPPIEVQKQVVEFLNRVNIDMTIDEGFPYLDEVGKKQINEFFKIRNTHSTLNEKFQSQKSLLSQLKQSILQEAIQGKLTEEWRALRQAQQAPLEPASELLKRIQAEKARLIKEKKIKKEKPLPPITDSEKPFELPEGWEWRRLGEICSKTGSGSTPSGGKSIYQNDGIKFIRSQNVYDDGLRLEDVAYISEQIHQKMKGTIVEPEDLLLNITGGSIGRCCIVPKGFDEGNINQHVAIIRPYFEFIGYFIHKVICSPYFQEQILKAQTGAGREGLPKNKMDNILIALPGAEEQKAIVEKVESLMEKCRSLEEEISQSEQQAQMLMQAVLKEAFEGGPDSQEQNKLIRDYSNKQVKSYQIPPVGELGMVGED